MRRGATSLLVLLFLVLLPAGGQARGKRRKPRVPKHHISIHNVNTGEKIRRMKVIDVDPGDPSRKYINKKARKRIRQLFRCRRTGRSMAIKDRLIWLLYILSYHYDQPIQLISGYRHKTRKTSRHRQGRAADFRIPGVSAKKVADYCKRRFKFTGVGYCPRSNFVHLDIRDRSYYWVDDSGRGEDADYREGVSQPVDKWKWERDYQKKKKKRLEKAKGGKR